MVSEPVPRKEDYNELIMAVVRKFPNETRHQTALRYIREAEDRCSAGEAKDAEATKIPPK